MNLLVTFSETPTLYEFVTLKRYLEDVLEREVDLGMPSALKEGPAPRRSARGGMGARPVELL